MITHMPLSILAQTREYNLYRQALSMSCCFITQIGHDDGEKHHHLRTLPSMGHLHDKFLHSGEHFDEFVLYSELHQGRILVPAKLWVFRPPYWMAWDVSSDRRHGESLLV